MVQDQAFAPAFYICCVGWLSTTLSSCKSVLVMPRSKSCPVLMQVINIPVTQFKAGTLPLAAHPIVSCDNSYPHRRGTGWGVNGSEGYRRRALPSVCTVLPLSDLHPVTKCLGEDLSHKLLPIFPCQTVTTVYFIVFSYHYRYAMIILIRTAAMPESSFRLSQKHSMERATVAYSKGILHPDNWEIVQDYNC